MKGRSRILVICAVIVIFYCVISNMLYTWQDKCSIFMSEQEIIKTTSTQKTHMHDLHPAEKKELIKVLGPHYWTWDEDMVRRTYRRDSLTVVTAYFNMGDFKKDNYLQPGQFRRHNEYYTWMTGYRNILNPVVAFFDTQEGCNIFNAIRAKLPKNLTKVILIKREDIWAFNKTILERTGEIFSHPSYPKYQPRTVIPAYDSAMHAKSALTKIAAERNYFNTSHLVWLDAGLWRHKYKLNATFRMALPYDFDDGRVAFDEVFRRDATLTPTRLILDDKVWLSGAIFVAKNDVMIHWADEYKKFVELFLSLGLMNSDEQIIYAMYADSMNEKPNVLIQAYRYIKRHRDEWFSLGYTMREIGMIIW